MRASICIMKRDSDSGWFSCVGVFGAKEKATRATHAEAFFKVQRETCWNNQSRFYFSNEANDAELLVGLPNEANETLLLFFFCIFFLRLLSL